MTLLDLRKTFDAPDSRRTGIPSICTAHSIAIEAALAYGRQMDRQVLIEATCNQVNHEGGYTGMTPGDFRKFVEAIAERVGFNRNKLILGGDHLGPNPWKDLPANEAMARARAMIHAYSSAGFTKLHLDTSMGCLGESPALSDETIAARAAELALVAEAAVVDGDPKPVYVIGTEVPVPGGADHPIDSLTVTTPEAALRTAAVHRQAFQAAGAERAFDRAIGLVVQPGVEFGSADVAHYDRGKARALSATLSQMPQFVFEAHSTDYQSPEALTGLVADGFAILKVGPWLTYAIRETLYGLDRIVDILLPGSGDEGLAASMERLMLAEPANWSRYYHGDKNDLRVQRHYSYSDRIRYYWPQPDAQAALRRLNERLEGRRIPETLISQFLGKLYPSVASGFVKAQAKDLQIAAVQQILDLYYSACQPQRQ